MRRLLLLLWLCLGLASAANLVGPPLPAPYQLRHTLPTGQTQVILATMGRVVDSPIIPGGKTLEVTSLLLARDRSSGRTLWKRYLGDLYELQAVTPTVTELTHVEGHRKWISWYSLQDGNSCNEGS